MTETTFPKPLSGAEIRTAILHDLQVLLERDDRLADHKAFRSFNYHAIVSIALHSPVGKSFTRELVGGQGVPAPDDTVIPVTVTATADARPPNEVRMRSGQPVPVLATEHGRTVERAVNYADATPEGKPKRLPTPSPPRNIVMGGSEGGE